MGTWCTTGSDRECPQRPLLTGALPRTAEMKFGTAEGRAPMGQRNNAGLAEPPRVAEWESRIG